MKQIKKDKQEIKLQAENQDDLWYLSHIIDPGDIVKGKTIRKIKLGEGTDRNVKIIKKPVFLKINVEKTELGADELRVNGKILEGPEDVTKGSYHTFSIESGTTFSIEKEKWLKYQLDKIKEASSVSPKIMIVVMDREEAFFALMKKSGYEVILHLEGDVQKKKTDEKAKGGFYAEIIKKLEEYLERYDLERIVVSSPAFFKEDLMKEVKNPEIKKRVILATCSSVGKNGIDETLKREETKEALRQQRASSEMKYIDELLGEISKNGKAAYGMKEVKNAAEAGAVVRLMVTDKLIFDLREKGKYEELDQIMKKVDNTKGDITIVSSEHEGGKRLDGLGGVGALLRYQMSY